MSAAVAKPRADATRKRRAHVKSRKGCGNCKLRRVKCDEGQPACRKCKLYGVSCDYSSLASSLELDAQGSFQVTLGPTVVVESSSSDDDAVKMHRSAQHTLNFSISPFNPVNINTNLATLVDDSHRFNTSNPRWMDSSWHFSKNQLEVLSRFRERTSLTIGSTTMAPLYRDLVCELACKHGFLMHMLLSVTLMHDAHLANPLAAGSATKTSRAALEHWNTASKLFNDVLSRPIRPAYRDAIWATGVFLGAASFWSIGSTRVYDVWPLKPEEPDDLAWLRIGEGKKHLWRLAQPLRSDSIFCEPTKDHSCLSVPEWATVVSPDEPGSQLFIRVMDTLDLTAPSKEDIPVYYHPILALSKCPNVKLTQENALKFLYIMAVITPEFLQLLEVKDMKAIFIIGWWYILLKTGDLWWMSRRARIEGQAIRIWLRRQRGGGKLADLLDEIERHAGREDEEGRWFFRRTPQYSESGLLQGSVV